MKMFANRCVMITALALLMSAPAWGQDESAEAASYGQAAFQRLVELEGTWTGTVVHSGGHTEDAVVTYATTAGGSSVIETLFAGTEHEMVTMYYVDGDQLKLTHYCMLGNQPTMAATPSESTDMVRFEFVGGSNIPDESAPHMHDAEFTFHDADHFESYWTMYQDGEPAGSASLELHRQTD